jgi:hypothetical protein
LVDLDVDGRIILIYEVQNGCWRNREDLYWIRLAEGRFQWRAAVNAKSYGDVDL